MMPVCMDRFLHICAYSINNNNSYIFQFSSVKYCHICVVLILLDLLQIVTHFCIRLLILEITVYV